MRFVSTRDGGVSAGLSEALRLGVAPDGGLFVPEAIPVHATAAFDADQPLNRFAADWLRPFFAGDPLGDELDAICAEAFTFPAPLVVLPSSLQVLELFHGPTGAFKDFGARFLMAAFDRLAGDAALTVLAATSGDTGGAVGCAAEGRRSVRAIILYPKGRVSPFQEHQLTCWGSNVLGVQVGGDFDDCQALVKAGFADPRLRDAYRLTSANSINLGRLLPQVAYLAYAAFRAAGSGGAAPGFIMPSGNLGHGYALLLARAMGAPVGPVVFATNANQTLADWHRTGRYEARASIATLANAMDVGNPSNFERLAALSGDLDLSVELVDDPAITARVSEDSPSYVWCPHGAIASEAWHRLPDARRADRPWVAAATAHPYKFREIVEPLLGHAVTPTPALADILDRPVRKERVPARLDALAGLLERQLVSV